MYRYWLWLAAWDIKDTSHVFTSPHDTDTTNTKRNKKKKEANAYQDADDPMQSVLAHEDEILATFGEDEDDDGDEGDEQGDGDRQQRGSAQ